MRYMMFIKHAEVENDGAPPQGLMDAMGTFITASLESGILVDTAGLRPTREGKRIRSSGGRLSTVDGPFAEAKEVIGGYAIVEAPSEEAAMALATEFVDLHRVHWPEFECACEVRRLDTGDAPPTAAT